MFTAYIDGGNNLNLNELRLALISFILSRQKNRAFAVVVKDLNKSSNSTVEADNIELLKKFAIDASKTVNQSQNINIYRQLAANLVKENKAYSCFCQNKKCTCLKLTQEEIKKRAVDGEKYSIKIKKPDKKIEIKDIITGTISIESFDDFEIIDSKGNPSQIFANGVDAVTTGVSVVIKTLDSLEESFKEAYIHSLLGANTVEFAHLQHINNAPQVKELLQKGYLPDAIINYLLNLGRNFDEIYYLPQAVENFDIIKLANEKLIFSLEAMCKINREHLLKMESKKLSKIFGFADSDIGEVLKIFSKESCTIKELDDKIISLFSAKKCTEEMKKLAEIIKQAPMITDYKEFIEYLEQKCDLSGKTLLVNLAKIVLGNKNIEYLEKMFPYINPYLLEVVKCI